MKKKSADPTNKKQDPTLTFGRLVNKVVEMGGGKASTGGRGGVGGVASSGKYPVTGAAAEKLILGKWGEKTRIENLTKASVASRETF